MKPTVVFDTNVVVSAALDTRRDVGLPGRPSLCLRLALSGHAEIVLSTPLLNEYGTVLLRPKFGLPKADVRRFISVIRRSSVMVEPTPVVVKAVRDPGDLMVLATAAAAKCRYLVTGNRRHFPDEFRGTRILTPREFLTDLLQDDQI